MTGVRRQSRPGSRAADRPLRAKRR